MSLLNDALRAAEQRQNRPEVAAAYTGQASNQRPGRKALWLVVLLLVAGLAAVPAIWFLTRDHSGAGAGEAMGDAPMAEAKEPQPQPETVVKAPERISEAPASEPTPSVERQAEQPVDAPVATVEHEASEAPYEPEPMAVQASVPQPQPVADPAPVPPAQTPVSGEPVSASTPEEELPAVKQVRETPEAMDRRVSQELASLLGNGEVAKAEQRLQALVAAQSAPASREVFARRMLVEGKPEHALAWLPADVTADVPDLRLLRARALHATDDLAGALSTLESSVPPVADNAGYRVTLATLLQQAGRSAESARHWSLLIAVDDSRAAWWVGLGIALESGGKPDSAARAYTQAAQLPGLSPSLADYVRERLRSLQAG
jgi:MSHA biogenesis protein MshN